MAFHAKHASGRSPGRGEYVVVILDDVETARFTCPTCGYRALLDDHTIRPGGQVEPSVVCPANCGFHDYVQLGDWGLW